MRRKTLLNDLVQALKRELRERTGNDGTTGECECCGGGTNGVKFHRLCCFDSRAILMEAESTLVQEKLDDERRAKGGAADEAVGKTLMSKDRATIQKLIAACEKALGEAESWIACSDLSDTSRENGRRELTPIRDTVKAAKVEAMVASGECISKSEARRVITMHLGRKEGK